MLLSSRSLLRLLLPAVGGLLLAVPQALAQRPAASAAGAESTPIRPRWEGRARYGGGPSLGPPPSEFTGATPPSQWCLVAGGPPPTEARTWTHAHWEYISRRWLRQVLTDTTEFGATWRAVLGGAPGMTPADSIVVVSDEPRCQRAARLVHRDVLGWQVGPPPVAVFRVRDYYIVFPSNARMGGYGFAVGLDSLDHIHGVATW